MFWVIVYIKILRNLFQIFLVEIYKKIENAESRSQRKGEEGREEGSPASHGRRQEGGWIRNRHA